MVGGSVGDEEVWEVEHPVNEEVQDMKVEWVAEVDLRSRSFKKEEELWIQNTRHILSLCAAVTEIQSWKDVNGMPEAYRKASRC